MCCIRCFNYVYVKKPLNSREYYNRYNDKCIGDVLLINVRYFFPIKHCMCGNGMGKELHFGTRCPCGGHCITDPAFRKGIYNGSIFYALR